MTIFQRQINDYLDYCAKVRRMSPATLRAKQSILACFARATRCRSLRGLDNVIFNRWVEYEMARQVSPRSINTYNAAILAMVKYYREMGYAIPLRVPLIKKLKEGEARRTFYTAAQIR